MGTRADFYIGCGKDATWLGSVGWDGYEWQNDPESLLMQASSEEEFKEAVSQIADERDDWTSPDLGWPWPWENSSTTDWTYFFSKGRTRAVEWGGNIVWPDMRDRQNVAMSRRSGLLLGCGLPFKKRGRPADCNKGPWSEAAPAPTENSCWNGLDGFVKTGELLRRTQRHSVVIKALKQIALEHRDYVSAGLLRDMEKGVGRE